MPRTKREHYTPEQKAAIVRRHLVVKVPVSQLCEELGIQPSVFYGWQKLLFENLEAVFAGTLDGRARRSENAELERVNERVAKLEAKPLRRVEPGRLRVPDRAFRSPMPSNAMLSARDRIDASSYPRDIGLPRCPDTSS